MTILSELYATGGDKAILHTIELKCDSWSEPVVFVRDYVNHTIVTEDDRTLEALACAMDISLPKRNDNPSQALTFALNGIRIEATKKVRKAVADGNQVHIIYRAYIEGELDAPANTPLKMVARDYKASGGTVEISAGLYDVTSLSWPRRTYNPIFSPGIKYL